LSPEKKVLAALTELGRRLHEHGIEAELFEIADAMADENVPSPLIRGWVNDKVVAILPRVLDSRVWQALNVPGLIVLVVSPEHLLAMRARAARGLRDFTDVAVLADTRGLK